VRFLDRIVGGIALVAHSCAVITLRFSIQRPIHVENGAGIDQACSRERGLDPSLIDPRPSPWLLIDKSSVGAGHPYSKP
jgi:hypothetical protein